jgi:hypothetical protein
MLKKRLMRIALFTAVLTVSAVSAGLLFAQDTSAAALAPFDPQAFIAAMFAAGLPFLTQGIRKLYPGLPRMAVWAIPPVLGSVLGYVGSLMSASAPGGWKGFALGLVAIALREAKSTFDDHGING